MVRGGLRHNFPRMMFPKSPLRASIGPRLFAQGRGSCCQPSPMLLTHPPTQPHPFCDFFLKREIWSCIPFQRVDPPSRPVSYTSSYNILPRGAAHLQLLFPASFFSLIAWRECCFSRRAFFSDLTLILSRICRVPEVTPFSLTEQDDLTLSLPTPIPPPSPHPLGSPRFLTDIGVCSPRGVR